MTKTERLARVEAAMVFLVEYQGWCCPHDDGPDGPTAWAVIWSPWEPHERLLGSRLLLPGRDPLIVMLEAVEEVRAALREGLRERAALRLVESAEG